MFGFFFSCCRTYVHYSTYLSKTLTLAERIVIIALTFVRIFAWCIHLFRQIFPQRREIRKCNEQKPKVCTTPKQTQLRLHTQHIESTNWI